MAKKVRKVDPKMVAKAELTNILSEALTAAGYTVESGKPYGGTATSLVLKGVAAGEDFQTDVFISLTTPAKGNVYLPKEDEEDEAA